ncbi:MAG: tetratricopeptide repeat protein, partial [Promethearchaeota archaeon]
SIVQEIKSRNNLLDERLIGNYKILQNKKLFLDFNSDQTYLIRTLRTNEQNEPGKLVAPTSQSGALDEIVGLIELGNYTKAINLYENILKDPKYKNFECEILINLGYTYASNQEYTKAIECYEKALKFDKNIPIIFFNLIRGFYLRGRKAIQVQMDVPLNVLFVIANFIKSKKWLDKFNLLDIKEKNSINKERLNDLKKTNEEIDNIFDYISINHLKEIQIHEIPIFLNELRFIDINLLKKIYKENESLLNSFLEMEPSELPSIFWNSMANVYIALNMNEKALVLIEKGLKYLKNGANYLILIDTKGEILSNLGNYNEAFENFSQILNLDKNDPRVKKNSLQKLAGKHQK